MKIKIALSWLIIMTVWVILGPWLSSQQPEFIHWDAMAQAPDSQFWFGTDVMGRDLYVRT